MIATIVDTVVASCDPDVVALFGSWAKGSADVYSDIDLLVVGPFKASPWLRDRELRDALRGFAIQFDLHLVTPAELLAAPRRSYLDTLRHTCRVLYARVGVDLGCLGLPDRTLPSEFDRTMIATVEGT